MDLKELAKSRNAKNVFCNRLGIQIRDIAPGRAVVVKTVGPEDVNPLGIPHGGVYFSMADTACGTAMAHPRLCRRYHGCQLPFSQKCGCGRHSDGGVL